MTECMAEPSVAEVVLNKGVLPLLNYYANHPGVCKMLLKRLITLWATSEKRVRVVAFVAIFRLAQNLPQKPLEWVLKVMRKGVQSHQLEGSLLLGHLLLDVHFNLAAGQ